MKCLPGLLRNRPDSQGLPHLSGCEEDETSREPSCLEPSRSISIPQKSKKNNMF